MTQETPSAPVEILTIRDAMWALSTAVNWLNACENAMGKEAFAAAMPNGGAFRQNMISIRFKLRDELAEAEERS